jgi:hypothetical protein
VSEKGPRWNRPKTPIAGVVRDRDVRTEKHDAIPESWDEPATGRVDLSPDELARIRSRRPTPERVSKLEVRVDVLHKELIETRLDVRGVGSQVKTILDYAVKAEAERERRAVADVVALERRRKFIIGLIGALGTAVAAIVTAWVMR